MCTISRDVLYKANDVLGVARGRGDVVLDLGREGHGSRSWVQADDVAGGGLVLGEVASEVRIGVGLHEEGATVAVPQTGVQGAEDVAADVLGGEADVDTRKREPAKGAKEFTEETVVGGGLASVGEEDETLRDRGGGGVGGVEAEAVQQVALVGRLVGEQVVAVAVDGDGEEPVEGSLVFHLEERAQLEKQGVDGGGVGAGGAEVVDVCGQRDEVASLVRAACVKARVVGVLSEAEGDEVVVEALVSGAGALAEAVDGLVESPGVLDAVRVVGLVAGRGLQVHNLVQIGVEVGRGDVDMAEVQIVRGGEL